MKYQTVPRQMDRDQRVLDLMMPKPSHLTPRRDRDQLEQDLPSRSQPADIYQAEPDRPHTSCHPEPFLRPPLEA